MALQTDGFSTTIAFSSGVSGTTLADLLAEKEVTSPGLDGGGPNDTSTKRNTIWRTLQPKSLISLTPCSFVAAWDPAVFNELVDMLNTNQSIVITYPDGATLTFWGWLNTATPGANVEGEQPTMDLEIQPSNQNAAGVETAPAFVAA